MPYGDVTCFLFCAEATAPLLTASIVYFGSVIRIVVSARFPTSVSGIQVQDFAVVGLDPVSANMTLGSDPQQRSADWDLWIHILDAHSCTLTTHVKESVAHDAHMESAPVRVHVFGADAGTCTVPYACVDGEDCRTRRRESAPAILLGDVRCVVPSSLPPLRHA